MVKGMKQGFTLIELVIVIVILGIISVGTFRFIGNSITVFTDVNEREAILSESRFALERMSRELRTAIPNSIRITDGVSNGTNFQCMEFSPFVLSSTYRSLPISPLPSSNTVETIAGNIIPTCNGDCFFTVNLLSANEFYTAANRHQISNIQPIIETAPDPDVNTNLWTITLANPVNFNAGSPARRFYIAQQSISYCAFGTQIFRYQYAINDNPPTLTTGQSGTNLLTGGVLMAENLANFANPVPVNPFFIENATLQRNALVNLYLQFQRADNGESFNFNKEVHIPNVN